MGLATAQAYATLDGQEVAYSGPVSEISRAAEQTVGIAPPPAASVDYSPGG